MRYARWWWRTTDEDLRTGDALCPAKLVRAFEDVRRKVDYKK